MRVEDIKDGMLLITRDGSQYYHIKNRMFYWKDKNRHDYYYVRGNYDNDLKCGYDSGLDIMKIYYMDKLIWERKTEWNNVPFGTKVIAWSGDKRSKQVGKLLHYDENGAWLKFLVFIDGDVPTKWFEHCELLEGGDIDG